jgi:hypothetical protein
VSPVRYEFGCYIPEDGIVHMDHFEGSEIQSVSTVHS